MRDAFKDFYGVVARMLFMSAIMAVALPLVLWLAALTYFSGRVVGAW
jgi:hypothetical protein